MSSSGKTPRRTRGTSRKAAEGSSRKAGKGSRKAAPGGLRRTAPAATAKAPAKAKPSARSRAAGGTGTARSGSRGSRAPDAATPAEIDAVEGGTDPAGFLVARVLGEEAVRDAPHPLAEGASDTGARVPEGVPRVPVRDERLGELPWGYGDDAMVALPRDPRSMYLYWDPAAPTLQRWFEGLDHPRAQLRVFARHGDGWDPIRELEVALESRSWYVHDLEPGGSYRAELHAVDRAGRERLLGAPSNVVLLPPLGPSPSIDDRFARLPWDRPLGGPLGPGHPRPGFPDEAREALARLSGRHAALSYGAGGPSGRLGGRPSPPTPGGEGER
jgi:hypothetical protein